MNEQYKSEYSMILYKNYIDIFTIHRRTKRFKAWLNNNSNQKEKIESYLTETEKRLREFVANNKIKIYIYHILGIILNICFGLSFFNLASIYDVKKEEKYFYIKSLDLYKAIKIYITIALFSILVFLLRRFRKVVAMILTGIIGELGFLLVGQGMYKLDPNMYTGNEQFVCVDYRILYGIYVCMIVTWGMRAWIRYKEFDKFSVISEIEEGM